MSKTFKTFQSRLDLNNAQLAQLCGVATRTVERWRQGIRKPAGPADKLLEICLMLHDNHPDVWAKIKETDK